MVELSDYDRTSYALAYSGETVIAGDTFRIKSFTTINLTVIEGVVYIQDAEEDNDDGYNFAKEVLKSSVDGGVNAVIEGKPNEIMPRIVGNGIGKVVGIASGVVAGGAAISIPVVGPAIGPITGAVVTDKVSEEVSRLVTNNILNNMGKPKPPLTKISTKTGIGSSKWGRSKGGVGRAPSIGSNSKGGTSSGGSHSGNKSSASCQGACHQ
ncbi:hypothetical protein LZS85_15465 [Aliivibrio fischeri]|uniref:hypothetical protein n=1 Tax=Aliivibrio fischeri TaxID=668 RepID=UPI001F2F67DD|nr:hypothetical protein [Aliivibrio fischeri]MCE7567521.1 hypothetical protein [Aliivibrio fischeri]